MRGYYYQPAGGLRAAGEVPRRAHRAVGVPVGRSATSCCWTAARTRRGKCAEELSGHLRPRAISSWRCRITASPEQKQVLPRLVRAGARHGHPAGGHQRLPLSGAGGRAGAGDPDVHPDGQDAHRRKPHAHGAPTSSTSSPRTRCARAFPNFAGRHRAHREDRRALPGGVRLFQDRICPHFRCPRAETHVGYSARDCTEEGLARRYAARPRRTRRSGMEYELGVISSMGYVGLLPDRVGFHPLRQDPRRGRGPGPRQRRGLHRGVRAWASPSIDPLKYDAGVRAIPEPRAHLHAGYRLSTSTMSAAGEVIDYVRCRIRRGSRGADHHLRHHGRARRSSATWAA